MCTNMGPTSFLEFGESAFEIGVAHAINVSQHRPHLGENAIYPLGSGQVVVIHVGLALQDMPVCFSINIGNDMWSWETFYY
jgi:hypothetical protein